MNEKSLDEILRLVKDRKISVFDLRFVDLYGIWQHFSLPISYLNEKDVEAGYGFDGSSIRGWKSINESDMLAFPDLSTAFVDPFMKDTTLVLVCDIYDPVTKERYSRDPRNLAKKAMKYLQSTGIAEMAYFGPELEFFVFDDVRFDNQTNQAFYHVDSSEGRWNSGKIESPNLAYKIGYKEGYFPVPPADSLQDIRSEMMLTMIACGIDVERQHHEVATAGQAEIDFKYDTLVRTADNAMLYKYIVKNVAKKYNKTATFMPKPLYGDNGTGMHTHQSLWKGGKPLFAGNEYAGFSEMGLYYIGGLLKHAHAILALTNPTTNSYRRLVPGYEAPVNLAYSQRNRSAAIRIPMYSNDPKTKRLEFRCPDPTCNPYLAFSAMLMAGIDGIQNRIHPGEPLDKNIYDLAPEELKNVPSTPGSLEDALLALQNDHEFLLKGEVFTVDILETWIHHKMKNEVEAIKLRPHPYEFSMYYDA